MVLKAWTLISDVAGSFLYTFEFHSFRKDVLKVWRSQFYCLGAFKCPTGCPSAAMSCKYVPGFEYSELVSWKKRRQAASAHVRPKCFDMCVPLLGPAPFPLSHFEIWTNTFRNLDKYFWNLDKYFWNLDKCIFHLHVCPTIGGRRPSHYLCLVAIITFWNLDKYILQFGQILLANCTNTFGKLYKYIFKELWFIDRGR